ncbi:MAG: ATP-binding protein [Chloroflexota bacterium]
MKFDRVWLYIIFVMVIIFFSAFYYFIRTINQSADAYAKQIALRDAIRFHNAVNEFRDYYSSVVVANLTGSNIEVTHDYHDKERAIPLPATLTRELGQNISDGSSASSMAFYSDYPFPWHEETPIDSDPFVQEALDYLRQNPNEVYFRYVDDLETGSPVLRYATPSIMSQSCVDCHNNHPSSPRKDWEVGDVRGVLEVSVPLAYEAYSQNTYLDINYSIWLSSVFLLVSAIALSLTGFTFRNFSLREIADRNKKLEDEILERERAEEKMRLAIREAREANKAKSRFLATMSHELRTPLNAIIGYSELLEEDFLIEDDQDTVADLGRIKQSGKHLLTVINDILDLSKIEAGKLSIELRESDISKLISQIEDFAQLFIDSSHIEFNIVVDPDIQTITTDVVRLRQILLNLLNNAIKFTDRGRIDLIIQNRMINDVPFVEFQVSDTGIGMSKDMIPKVMNPFVQGDSGTDRKYGGTGLGLSITNSLCVLLGGRLEVISHEGHGSTFIVLLPDKKIVPILA